MKIKNINRKYIPLMIAGVIAFIGILFYNNVTIMGNLILLASVIGIVPYAFLTYFGYKKIRDIEDQLPTFLLDLAEAQKVGMTLPESLKQVSKTDYGKLSGEIKKINDQLSWGIPVQDVMNNFAKRMEKSKVTARIIRIINEAYSSGGDIARTMEATASDMTAIKEAEKERMAVAKEHLMVMYAIYFIFIGIVIGLSQTLVPMLKMNIAAGSMGGMMSFQDPCTPCANISNIFCVNCSLFTVLCQMFGFAAGGTCYYNSLFIVMAIVQGIFTGLVAGQLGEGSVIAGIKHSVIMTGSGFGVLLIMLKFVVV
jgi:flagellar protein FlaJ